mgnify:CR=1 FL=1
MCTPHEARRGCSQCPHAVTTFLAFRRLGGDGFVRSFKSSVIHDFRLNAACCLIALSKLGPVLVLLVMRSSLSLLRSCARTTAPRAAWACPAEHIPVASKRLVHTPRTSALTRPSIVLSRSRVPSTARFESSAATPPQNNTSTQAPESRLDRDQVPSYELTFTCNVCKTRSSHRLSKQGYHKGTILISCPGCKNRHLISDHLKVCCTNKRNTLVANPLQIFSDKSVTIEDLIKEKGSLVKRGSLSAEGDVEFWDDGTSTPRSAHFHTDASPTGEERLTDKNQSSSPTPKE